MRVFPTIATNAFMELVRQPVFLLLFSASSSFMIFLAAVPYFGFGDDPKLVKDGALAVMLVSGLFGAVISASSSVAHEIRTGTALAVLAKPVGRARFLLAKFAGVAGALALLTYVNLLAALLASRMAFDAYGDADMIGSGIFFAALAGGYLTGALANYFLGRPFVASAVFASLLLLTLAFVVINFLDKKGVMQGFGVGVDWRMIPVSVLVMFALWILAAIAMACSTRLELMPTLSICTAIFLLGLMSDYFFGAAAREGKWWAQMLYTIIPNWQQLWMADALEPEKTLPWRYIGSAFAYVTAYLGVALSVALYLFEDRELS